MLRLRFARSSRAGGGPARARRHGGGPVEPPGIARSLVLALLLFPAGGGAASDGGVASDSGTREFAGALALVDRDDARAAAALEGLAESRPEGEFAADAIAEAARIEEERLGRPDRAAALYARILERYPSSRHALRARARAEFLRWGLQAGPGPLAEYQSILLGYASRPPEESRARMERLLAAHPEFPLAGQGRLWLARGDSEAGRAQAAIARFAEIEAGAASPELLREARKGRADAALSDGQLLEARRLYAALASDGDRGFAEVGRAGAAAVNRALLARALTVASALALLAFLVGCAIRGRGSLARAPLALQFYLPVAAVFVLAAVTQHRAIARATGFIAVAGALVLWLGGAATERRLARGPIPPRERFARAAAAGLAILAAVYLGVRLSRVADVVWETLRNGPDR